MPPMEGGRLTVMLCVLARLQVKNQLLLAYCTNVAFYTVLKASGQPVVDHPVGIGRAEADFSRQ